MMWRLKSAGSIYKTWLQNIKLVLIMFCIIREDQFLSFDQCKALKHEPHIDLYQKIVRPGILIKVDRISG